MHQLIFNLKHGSIKLNEEEDESIWLKNKATRRYMAKPSYEVRMKENEKEENKWWWKNLCKLKCPLKTRIFIQFALSQTKY